MVGVGLETGVEDALDRLVARKRRGDLQGVGALPLDAQGQRLHPAEEQPAVKWRWHRADRVLVEAQLLLQLVVAGHHGAANDVAVPADVLGRAVHDDVRAQVQRLLQVRRREGVVDAHERATAVRHLAHGVDVDHAEQRVGRRLQPHHAGLLGHRGLDLVDVARVHGGEAHAVALEDFVEQAERAAVHVFHVDHVVARVELQHERRLGAESRREGKAVFGVFERGKAFLEGVARRVARPRILESLVLAHALLGKGRRHVDRLHHGPGSWIRPLPDMQSPSGKPPVPRRTQLLPIHGEVARRAGGARPAGITPALDAQRTRADPPA